MGETTMTSTNGGQGPLTRQGSLYNLTLDEVQNHLGELGKPLMSMNLEEFLRTITSAEESLGANAVDAADPAQFISSTAVSEIQRQPSFLLNQDLGNKTVDDIWREIQQVQGKIPPEEGKVQRQPTLGEMTLEDFLFRAGALSQNSDPSLAPPAMPLMPVEVMPVPQQDWIEYQLANATAVAASCSSSAPPPPHQNLTGMYMPGFGVGVSSPVLDVGYMENPMTASSPLMAMPLENVDRKRTASDEVRDRAIDRRQKRMIKNRESAARSRARKQAYTSQLEGEVSQLKDVNTRLKKEKELDNILSTQISAPRYQLRRTNSAPV
ncbi:ABSCISIC ACID-INSENSITIVE 5-like protein 2 [Nymphaea colorata]|nr:ABSCISIC ACID-INSENSITIVE 5-like protein 2 [Nymphaea colorata]